MIIKSKSFVKKILSLVFLLVSLSLQLVTFWSYILAVSLVLNDPSDFIYLLCLKLNFKEIKQINKHLSLKSLVKIVEGDVYSRFSTAICCFYVLCQNILDFKINTKNFLFYFTRVGFVLGSEILFDWVKYIFFFKISGVHPKFLKLLTFEFSVLHEKFHLDRKKGPYVSYIRSVKLLLLNRHNVGKFKNFLETDNMLSIEMRHSNMIHSIIIGSLVVENIGLKLLCGKTLLMFVIVVLWMKIYRLSVRSFVLDQIESISAKHYRKDGKLERRKKTMSTKTIVNYSE